MRKIIICFLTIVILFLAACSSNNERESIYTTLHQNKEYIINTENQTISSNNHIYKYEIDNNEIRIVYPDNSTYWRKYQGNTEFGGWSDDYDEYKYVSGDVLIDVLSYKPTAFKEEKSIFVIILLIVVGIWSAISPRSSWYVSHGWRYKNAEPSDFALVVTRLGGIIAVIISLVMIFS